MTKTVSDAALILDQIAGPDPRDPYSLPAQRFRYLDRIDAPFERPLRIGFSRDFGGVPVQRDIAEQIEEAVETFRKLGHDVRDVSGGPPDLGMYWGLSLARQLELAIGKDLAGREGDVMRALVKSIEIAKSTPSEWWAEQARARMQLVHWFADVFDAHDLLLTPTVPCDPPPVKGPLPEAIDGVDLPVSGIAAFTLPVNLAWLPAATVRAGKSRAGFPIGL